MFYVKKVFIFSVLERSKYYVIIHAQYLIISSVNENAGEYEIEK